MSLPAHDEPYVGPRPFQREDAGRFFGRDAEAADLVSLSIAHRALLLYAPSGAGKSSLLSAKVVPALTKEHDALVLGPARVSGTIASQRMLDALDNVGLHHLLASLGLASDRSNEAAFVDALEKRIEAHATSTDAPVVLVIDQFEELFTHHAERWRDREPFLRALGTASERLPSLRIVLSMREEHLAQLVPFARHLPDKLRGRYRLERLRSDAAREAIERPLDATRRRFAPGAANVLVQSLMRVPVNVEGGTRDVEGEFVEPVHLQVVCRELWSKLPADVTTIDARSVESVGNVDDALSRYYESCVATIAAEFALPEERVRAWFEEQLVTSDGTRGIVHKGVDTTAGLPTRVVERLENLHVVRAEVRGGATFYELTHDRLLQPIRRANRLWRESRRPAELDFVGASLDERLARWASNGRTSAHLLGTAELEIVERWLKSGASPPQTEALRDFLAQSRLESERSEARAAKAALAAAKKQRVVLLIVVTVIGALLVLMTIGGIFAAKLYVDADDARAAEAVARAKANEARDRAENAVMLERARLSTSLLSQRGREFEALAQGVHAVLPALEHRTEPPPEALAALRAAAAPLASSVPLVTSGASASNVVLDEGGQVALAWGDREIAVFDARTGALRFAHAAPIDATWSAAVIDRSGARVAAILRRRANEPSPIQQTFQKGAPDREDEWRLAVFDAQSGLEIGAREFRGRDDVPIALDAARGRAFVASASSLRVLSIDAAAPETTLAMRDASQATLSPDGARALVRHDAGATLVDLDSGRAVAEFPAGAYAGDPIDPYACAFASASHAFAFLVPDAEQRGGRSVRARVHAAADGRALAQTEVAAAGETMWIGFVENDLRLVVLRIGGGGDPGDSEFEQDATVFSVESGAAVWRRRWIGAIVALPRGDPVVIGRKFSNAHELYLWDLRRDESSPIDVGEFDGSLRVDADRERRVLALTPALGAPSLRFVGQKISPDASLASLLALAEERLRGRAEHAALLEQLRQAQAAR